MRGQSVIISAYMAALVLVLAFTVLFVSIFPRTTSVSFQFRQFDIVRLVRTKTYWTACDLAGAVADNYGADYVDVNITVYDLVHGKTLGTMRCIRKPLDVGRENLITYTYHFSRLLGNGTMYIYDIEVGYK